MNHPSHQFIEKLFFFFFSFYKIHNNKYCVIVNETIIDKKIYLKTFVFFFLVSLFSFVNYFLFFFFFCCFSYTTKFICFVGPFVQLEGSIAVFHFYLCEQLKQENNVFYYAFLKNDYSFHLFIHKYFVISFH